MITNVIGAQTAPHLLAKAIPRLEGPDHPDALVKSCVTRAREFTQLATHKSPGRLYRLRVSLTVEANGGVFDPNSSEEILYFDCYLLPRKVPRGGYKKAGGDLDDGGGEPPGPAYIGERITLSIMKDRKKDEVTVKQFEVIVTDVFWGSVVRTLDDGDIEERNSLTQGLIEARVQGRYERSLIMDSEFALKKYKYSIAA